MDLKLSRPKFFVRYKSTLDKDDQSRAIERPILDTFEGENSEERGSAIPRLSNNLYFNVLEAASGTEHLYNLSRGTPLGIYFSEKLHDPDDAYIEEAPLRKDISAHWLANHSTKLQWLERAGVLHLGAQLSSFVPVAAIPGASVGPFFSFSVDSIVRFRQLAPNSQEFRLPVTPELAQKMQPGSEAEFVGLLKGAASAGVFLSAGQYLGPALFGLTAFINGGVSASVEYSVNVLALDANSHVRVTIRRLNQKGSSFAFGVTAGLLYQFAHIWGNDVSAHLTILPHSTTTTSYLGSITGVTSASAAIAQSFTDTHAHIIAFDIDLSQEEGKSIYKSLLHVRIADALLQAKRVPQIVQLAKANQDASTDQIRANVLLLGETVAENTIVEGAMTGDFSLPCGESISYKDNSVRDIQKFWLKGHREVTWQEVQVTNQRDATTTPYFHFEYKDLHYRFSRKSFSQFLRFVQSLGITKSQLTQIDFNALMDVEDALAKSNKVEIKTDIFFTPQGIRKISETGLTDIERTYILASQKTNLDFVDTPLLKDDPDSEKARSLLQKFETLAQKTKWDIFQISPKIDACHREYEDLTGRSLSMDFGLLKQAQSFAQMIHNDATMSNDATNPASFILKIGRKSGFNYQQSIATLTALAGRENVRIHALSLKSGSKINFEVLEKSELLHPEEEFSRYLVTAPNNPGA